MGKVYKNQTQLTIQLTTDQTLGAGSAVIKYIKPDGDTGQFTATIVPNSGDDIVQYVVSSASDIDQVGEWTFWSYCTFAGGGIAAGEPVKVKVYEQGK